MKTIAFWKTIEKCMNVFYAVTNQLCAKNRICLNFAQASSNARTFSCANNS